MIGNRSASADHENACENQGAPDLDGNGDQGRRGLSECWHRPLARRSGGRRERCALASCGADAIALRLPVRAATLAARRRATQRRASDPRARATRGGGAAVRSWGGSAARGRARRKCAEERSAMREHRSNPSSLCLNPPPSPAMRALVPPNCDSIDAMSDSASPMAASAEGHERTA